MEHRKIEALLEQVREGSVPVREAADKLRFGPVMDLGFASLDGHRRIRCGFPEVVFCEGKTPEQVATILDRLREHETFVLATRVNDEQFDLLASRFADVHVDRPAKIAWLGELPAASGGLVAVVTAGTSDLPVAREAELTARALGCDAKLIVDVGVAGLERILGRLAEIGQADVVVVVAGMEGALASVVGGLVDVPVIAVPTSVGYGANFHGVSALLCMLTSCAANVAVVNIDSGFCGGFVAGLIARQSAKRD